MLQQILSHTPLYVWAILAFLLERGFAASRDREIAFGKLLIIPVVMLALSLQDISAKFGLGAYTLSAWAVGAALAGALTWQFGTVRVSAGAQRGQLLVRGSWTHLAVMMTIFLTKYVTSVLLVMNPQARHDALVALGVCVVFGMFNGILFGRLARTAAVWSQLNAANAQPIVSQE